jgi:ribonuclease HI
LDTNRKTGLLCYTDGSGRDGNSGAVIAIYKDEQRNAIHTDSAYTGISTVFQAELCAIQMACVFATEQADTQILILSDSQAAILATRHPLIYSRTVLETINSLNKLAISGKEVTLQWVQGHNQTAGNDMADLIAKTGAVLPASGPEPFLPLSRAVCRQAARDQLLHLWTSKWQRSRDYQETKIFFPTPNNIRSKNLLRFKQTEVGLIIRHITGFSYLNYPQSLQQFGLDPTCRLCGECREESNHIIRNCPALTRTRTDSLWQHTITDNDTWLIGGLLTFLSSPIVARLDASNRTGFIPTPDSPPQQAVSPLNCTVSSSSSLREE